MREHGGEWTAEAHWRPYLTWHYAGTDEGTFYLVIRRTSRSGTVRRLLIKLTRRNRSHEMMMATTMMMVTMMMMVMILI